MLTVRFDKVGKTNANACSFEEFKESIDSNLMEQLKEGKFKFILDLQIFNNICYEINLILSKHNYFLRIFELKDKYNGFQVIFIEFERKKKKI